MSKDLSYKEFEKTLYLREVRWLLAFFATFYTVILFFVGQLLSGIILLSVTSILGYNSSQVSNILSNNPAVLFLAVLFSGAITIGLLWLFYSLINRKFWLSVGLGAGPKLYHVWRSLLAYGTYFLTLIAVVAVVSNFVPAVNVNQMQQLGFESVGGTQLIFVFLTLVILPPVVEEIIFRGFLFRRLKKLINVYPAAIITSVIFALAHTEFLGDNPLNWIAAIDTFILSFFLIYLLLKTNSLWPSIFLHGIKNCIAFVVLFMPHIIPFVPS